MKKLIILFSMFFIFAHTMYADTSFPSQPVNVVIDGKISNVINAYNVSGQIYFSLKEIAKLYKLDLEWKSVSMQVKIHFENGKTIVIKVDSNDVVFEKTIKKMSLPSILIKNDIYVPPEILELPEFSKFSQSNTKCNLSDSTLNISYMENILAVKCLTQSEKTQVLIQLKRELRYTISKTSKTITLKILHGKIKNNSINVNNGVIENIQHGVYGRFAVVKINLAQHPKTVETTKLLNPHGISVDIVHSKSIQVTDLIKEQIQTDEEEYVVLADNLKANDLISPEKYGQAQISEFEYMIENNKDDNDFESIPVTKFEQNSIVDDSSTMVDDIAVPKNNLPKNSLPKNVIPPSHKYQKIIVLDAGHGGKDYGVVSPNGVKGKDLNLEIVNNLKSILKKNKKYKVILTRQDDTFVDFTERVNIANKYKADLFISVQCSMWISQINGFEVYCLSQEALDFKAKAATTLENSQKSHDKKTSTSIDGVLKSMAANEYINESLELGGLILTAAKTHNKFNIQDRNVKQANFYVLKGTMMPSVLVKGTFCTKESKADLKKFQTAITQSIYTGIVEYNKYYEKKHSNE